MGQRLVPAGHEQFLDSGGDQSLAGCEGLSPPAAGRAHGLRQNFKLSRLSGLHPDGESAQHRRVYYRQRGQSLPVHSGVSGVRPLPELQLYAGHHLLPRGAQRHPLPVEDRRAPSAAQHLHWELLQRVPGAKGRPYAAARDDGQLHFGGHLFLQWLHVLLQPFTQWQDARLGTGDPLH